MLVNRADAECESYADAAFTTMRDLHAAFAANEPFVPWEYHATVRARGRQALLTMHGRTLAFDGELNAASLSRLEELASLGLGAIAVPLGREVTASELLATPALSHVWLKRPLAEALATLLSPRYPLLKIETGSHGEPMAAFA